MRVSAYRTDEPCPGCGNDLTLLDDGSAVLVTECRSCGWSANWQAGMDGEEWA